MTKQDQAIERVLTSGKNDEVYIGGVAGSGKTFTLVRAYNELLQRHAQDEVVVLAPTNKAAHVMRQRGIPAGTIHSFMYHVSERTARDDKGNVIYLDEAKTKPKTILIWHHKLDDEGDDTEIPSRILVDECSMVGGKLYKDLSRFRREYGTQISFFGDAFQLPPVKDEVIFQARTPDVFLDEIHRVAQGNPILQYADFIRNNPSDASYPRWEDFPRANLYSLAGQKMIHEPEAQIISWTNATRNKINAMIRAYRGYESVFPQVGERLIILNNIYSKGLYNGTFVRLKEIEDKGAFFITHLQVEDDEDNIVRVNMGKAVFHPEGMYKTSKNDVKADYAYCITAHKSQGSEWPNVVVVDQRQWMKEESMKQSWFYTAITRTRDRLSIIK